MTDATSNWTGTIEERRRIDPAWTMKTIKWTRAIGSPEHLEGALIGLPGKP